MDSLPNDPVMLMSVVNMKLRDCYGSLQEMCDDLGIDQADLKARLASAGFEYLESVNQFR